MYVSRRRGEIGDLAFQKGSGSVRERSSAALFLFASIPNMPCYFAGVRVLAGEREGEDGTLEESTQGQKTDRVLATVRMLAEGRVRRALDLNLFSYFSALRESEMKSPRSCQT